MNQPVEAFFKRYERAISESDTAVIGSLYADVFMYAGPQGVQPVKKEDFLKVIPKRRAWLTSMGLTESLLDRVEQSSLDAKYTIAKTWWRMTFEKNGERKQIETRATYVLEQKGDSFQIVFQIDHQDLAARVKDIGLP